MRRFVLSFAAALSALALTACGGTALNTTHNPVPTAVLVSVASPLNIASVLPGAGIALSAVQVNGSQNGVLSGNRYTWSATVTSGQQYAYNASGQTKPCGSLTSTTGGVTTPYTPDYSIYITIDPSNEANVIFTPPRVIGAAAGTTITVTYPYCVTVTAQAVESIDPVTFATLSTGPSGSITVAVADPQNPLQ